MTPKELIGAFEVLADAPDAVTRLRELVLQLAVRGRLVPQDRADEPANVLLERIAANKARQAKQKKMRQPRELPPIAAEDAPFPLPDGWEWVRLGELGEIYSGDSIPAARKRDVYSKVRGGRPYIATKDVGYGRAELDYDNGVRIPSDEPKFKVAEPGAVLVCSEGGSAGRKVGFVRQQICFGNKLIANRPYEGVSPEYLFYFCQSPSFRAAFRERMTGIIGGIALRKFLAIEFPLPPLAEQHRIASRVCELEAILDRLEAAQGSQEVTRQALRDAALSALRDADDPESLQSAWTRFAQRMGDLLQGQSDVAPVRRTILQLAVRGRLVPRGSELGPPLELLKQAEIEREELAASGEARQRRHPGVRIERGWTAPSGWASCCVFDIATSLDHKRKPIKKDERARRGGSVPYYGANGPVGFIDEPLFDEPLVLVVEDETFVGRVKPFSYLIDGPSWVNNHAHVLRPTSIVLPAFLNMMLMHYPFTDATSGTTNRRKLLLPVLLGAEVALPPLEEQSRIVDKVEELMALCDELEERLGNASDSCASFATSTVASFA